MSAAFARYLPQFTVNRPGDLLATGEIFLSPKSNVKESTRDIVAEAEERGRREGGALARAEAQQARAEAESAFERRMDDERRRWTQSQAEVLTTRISDGLAQIEARIATAAARILVPFLEAKLRDKALAGLTRTLHELLGEGSASGLTISGPEDLLATIRSRLGTSGGALRYTFDEAPDIRISGDDIAIETQLRAWAERIGQAVAGS